MYKCHGGDHSKWSNLINIYICCGRLRWFHNVAFWTYKKTSCLPAANKAHKRRPCHSETASCLPVANKAHKQRPRHSETAGPWGTDRACGQRPPVPNVAFWTYKKTCCLPAANKAHKRRPRHSETAVFGRVRPEVCVELLGSLLENRTSTIFRFLLQSSVWNWGWKNYVNPILNLFARLKKGRPIVFDHHFHHWNNIE